jgi:flagellar basal body rod protein FlgB
MKIENNNINNDVEKLKLFKNTKGYNWEIQIIGIDIERLKEINEKMKLEYGNEE